MRLRTLRPVGEPVVITGQGPLPEFAGYHLTLLDSGTSALALAAREVLAHQQDKRRKEIIIPGYGCPDLVAALEYAGAVPVLVDTAPDSPRLDQRQLRHAINERTAAIVAVTFLGIREDFAPLRKLCEQHELTLVEDSAQWIPLADDAPFEGDYVVLSFGRGKPVNLLGGGALLSRASIKGYEGSEHSSSLPYLIKCLTYNLLITPWLYGPVTSLPGLGLGETRFEPLETIKAMPGPAFKHLPSNLAAYRARPRNAQLWLRERLEGSDLPLTDLPRSHGLSPGTPLLRYPLLLRNRSTRDHALRKLHQAGLGASPMYPRELPAIPGVADRVKVPFSLENARSFSDRLMTLPTHSSVSEQDCQRILQLLSGFSND